MTPSTPPQRMPTLPRPGQQVRWRDLAGVRAWHWTEVFGPGPFEVVGLVDHSDQCLAAGVLVRTLIGEREISEVWLAPASEPGSGMNPLGDRLFPPPEGRGWE